jgi:glycosyl hydrolase family 42 (putative beta-galactosidase)
MAGDELHMSRRSFAFYGVVFAVAGLLAGCATTNETSSVGGASAETDRSAAPSASPIAASGKSVRPVGLIAVQEYQPGQSSVFSNAVFENASIAGVAPRFNWKDLEPSANEFMWQALDGLFAQAAASRKFVALILVPGFGAPAWALQGVTTATFARQYGAGAGASGDLPMPWDQVYLSRWFAFLQDVADRYASNSQFRMIAAAGPTSVSVEMSLPNSDSDIARWMTLGYTPDKYEAAWATVFQEYSRIFPRQYVSLALYPGLRIGNSQTSEPRQSTATPQSILAEGLAYDRFALQTSGLTGTRSGSDLYDLVSSNSGKVVTGFQLTTSATTNPAEMGDAASPEHALMLSLQLGVAAHVDFLEVYEADVVNPVMQTILQMTQAQLSH